jgi:hypothetical protein
MLFPLPSDEIIIPHFWAGGAATHSLKRPSRRDGKLMGQSAGWIASRQELLDLNRMCHGGFLPPFQDDKDDDGGDDKQQPHKQQQQPKFMPRDGLDHNVEFWSGGIQMSSEYCNIQRIAPLNDPEAFSRHLLYHTANVKQLKLQDRLVRIDDFMGQMNTVQKMAQRKMMKRMMMR